MVWTFICSARWILPLMLWVRKSGAEGPSDNFTLSYHTPKLIDPPSETELRILRKEFL